MDLNNINDVKDYFKEIMNGRKEGDEDSFYKKIKTGNVVIQYGTMEEQKNANDKEASSIDLGDCEQKLKAQNGISPEKKLIVYKIDVKTSDLTSTFVQYEVYNPDNMNNPLNLDICEKVIIDVPVDVGNEMKEIYNTISDDDYNLFDSEDSFYQDICTTYTSLNGTDMILSDRKKDIYGITSDIKSCQTGCTTESYDPKSQKAKCNCDVSATQSSLSNVDIDSLFDKNEIKSSFYDTLSNSNFRVLKCIKLVFSSKFFKNIGGIFMTLLFLAFLAFHSLSFVLHQTAINKFISKIINLKDENFIPNSMGYNDIQKDPNETQKTNKEEKKSKKKKKKNKKKKGVEEAQFPPKKAKKKNIKSDNNKIANESSNNDIISVNNLNNDSNKNNKNNGIDIYSKEKVIDNEKIILEKKMIDSKDGLEKTIDEKENKEDNIDITKLNDQEINDLNYEIAIKIDKRTYFQYYWSLLKKKHLILFTFWPANDYNIYNIKVSLFLLSFGLFFSINGFFFTDDTMHKLYEDKGKYNIVYRIPQILFSTIISAVINVLLKKLSLTEANIISIKAEKNKEKILEKSKQIKKCLRLKFLIYFILSIIFMLFFWYFISLFIKILNLF